MNVKKLLLVIAVLQGLMLAGVFPGPAGAEPAAAPVLDPGAQRLAILEELRGLNSRMDKLMGLLESGKVQVRVVPTDEKAK